MNKPRYVYVLERIVPYESSDVAGVYWSKAAAELEAKKCRAIRPRGEVEYYVSRHYVRKV